MDLTIQIAEERPPVVVFKIKGAMADGAAQAFADTIHPVVDGNRNALVFDMRDVDYISSMGLRELILVRKRLAPIDGRLLMYGLRPELVNVLRVTNVVPADSIFETLEQALAGGAGGESSG